ncbi:hypothetical protein GCM10008932_05750 [Alkalibacterium iburiense]|uniref:HTH cro/C1-type domain-containing protein n=1 Tax=Alkalibacterium iburiense TaxID=290589 RepID=A0ABN0X5N6_9LACT
MYGNRITKLRNDRNLTLQELGEKIGRSASTISRYESNSVAKWDPSLINKIADVLDTSSAFLMGMTDDPKFMFMADFENYIEEVGDEYCEENLTNILVTNEDMAPEIPYGALVKIRPVLSNEKLQIGAFYYIEFNNNRCFRMVIDDYEDGIGFLPNSLSERRIAYDPNYVEIIGKAISMKVKFEDIQEYE